MSAPRAFPRRSPRRSPRRFPLRLARPSARLWPSDHDHPTRPAGPPGGGPARHRHRPRAPLAARVLGLAGAVLVVAGVAVVAAPRPAAAEVVHGQGWSATVAGWDSWYGSYGMGELGTAWCIDHGSAAPDAAFGYVPADLSGVPADTQAAMAWALGTTGPDPGPVGAAALMLVLHDLMGATYPTGPLDVGALAAGDLAGFGGAEGDVLAAARALMADALAHAGVRGPLAMAASVDDVPPGQAGTFAVAVTDADGNGVAGVRIRAEARGASLTAAEAVTGADGRAAFGFTAGPDENRFAATAAAPDPTLAAFASSTAPAQRVAVPRVVRLSATAGFAPPPSTVRVDKTGDAEAYLPVAGARFEVRTRAGDGEGAGAGDGGVVARLVVGDDGTTAAAPVPPGRYVVHEVEPPPGYEAAPPTEVEVAPGDDAVVEVHDRSHPGWARITKVDASTGDPVAGAVLSLAYDADRDGTYETELDPVETGAEPAEVRLRPGDYQLTEVRAPDGYEGLDHPIDLSVRPGERVEVRVENRPGPTEVTGEKVDAESGEPVEGAVYDLYRQGEGSGPPRPHEPPGDAVEVDGATWVARATSDAGGAVRWGPQPPGAVYCAREHAAPDGYRLDETLRCTEGPLVAGTPATIRLPDRPVGPPPTSPPTTSPPTTTPPTTPPPTSPRPTVPPRPPSTLPPRPPGGPVATITPPDASRGALPETGAGTRTAGLASVGGGLLSLGVAALVAARPGGQLPAGAALGPPGSRRPAATRPARPAPRAGSAPRSPAAPAGRSAGRWRRRS